VVLDEITWEWLDPEVVQAREASRQYQFELVVTDTGSDPQAVARALGQAADYSMSMAKRILRRVPVSVGQGLSAEQAAAIREAVEGAGGSVTVRERPLANVPLQG